MKENNNILGWVIYYPTNKTVYTTDLSFEGLQNYVGVWSVQTDSGQVRPFNFHNNGTFARLYNTAEDANSHLNWIRKLGGKDAEFAFVVGLIKKQ